MVQVGLKVAAGFPSPALDYQEERVSLDEVFIRHPLSTFLIECTGDSMVDAFIPPRARLLVDRSLTAKNGDIVLAEIDGEFTVKFLKKTEFRCSLVPANNRYPEIEISGEQPLMVWGVVTAIITEAKDIRPLMM